MDDTGVGREQTEYGRTDLCQLLLHADRRAVIACAARFVESFEVEDSKPLECGLLLLPLEGGALATAFHIGEVPVSTSHISLKHRTTSVVFEGGAAILRDDSELARAIAVLDAARQQTVEPTQEIIELLREAEKSSRRSRAVIQGMIEQTRVDFSVLSGGSDAA